MYWCLTPRRVIWICLLTYGSLFKQQQQQGHSHRFQYKSVSQRFPIKMALITAVHAVALLTYNLCWEVKWSEKQQNLFNMPFNVFRELTYMQDIRTSSRNVLVITEHYRVSKRMYTSATTSGVDYREWRHANRAIIHLLRNCLQAAMFITRRIDIFSVNLRIVCGRIGSDNVLDTPTFAKMSISG